MKTNFLQKNSFRSRRRSGRREALVITVVFIAGVLVLSVFGGALSTALAPLWRSNTLLTRGISNLVGSLREKDMLITENTALKERLASSEELIIALRGIASQRDELLATFGRRPPESIPASVLVHPPETPYDVLVIDAGKDLGVGVGSAVTTPEGNGLGLVSAAFAKTAEVRLSSTSGERTDAVLERGGIPVTLVGRGGGNFSFTVPRDTAVELGDRILTPNLDARLLGVVGDIEVTPTDSFKTVLVRSPVNPSEIRFVTVLR